MDGVIQLPSPTRELAINSLCGDAGRADAFLQEMFEAERPALVGQADFRKMLLDMLAKWDATVSVDHALSVWHRIQPDPGALLLIRQLRSNGKTVALASNQQAHRARYMRDTLGYGA